MLFEKIRSLICPFDLIEQYVPKQGKVLDLGCGHGIFAALLARKSAKRKVLGIDPADYKIKIAQKNYRYANLKFQKAYLKDIRERHFDCLVIIDVLYLLPDKEKARILNLAKQMLNKNGLLLIKTVSHSPKVLFLLSKLEEIIMVQLLKYTYSDTRQLHFLPKDQYERLIKQAGFQLEQIKDFQGMPYRHHLFIAKKP